MSFKDKLARASARTTDVRILLNGSLLTEREALEAAVAEAKQQAGGWLGGVEEAQAALGQFDERISDEFIVVRISELPHARWRSIQLAHPMAADLRERGPIEKSVGFEPIGAAMDVCAESAVIVESDGSTYAPTEDDWRTVWDAINAGDMVRIALAVVDLCESTAYGDYRSLGKR